MWRAGRVLPFKLWGPLPVTVKKGHFAPNWKALTTHFVVLVVVQNYYPIRLVDLRALKESCCSRPPFLFRAQFEPSYALNWKRRKKKTRQNGARIIKCNSMKLAIFALLNLASDPSHSFFRVWASRHHSPTQLHYPILFHALMHVSTFSTGWNTVRNSISTRLMSFWIFKTR